MHIMELNQLFETVETKFKRIDPGWGGDGYILNGKTAKQLVEIWKQLGVLGALDWQMALVALDSMDNVKIRPAYRHIRNTLKSNLTKEKAHQPIRAGVINIGLVSAFSNGYSSINLG